VPRRIRKTELTALVQSDERSQAHATMESFSSRGCIDYG